MQVHILPQTGMVTSNSSVNGPDPFSVEIWFSTTGTGLLISFSNSNQWSRQVSINSSGQINLYNFYGANGASPGSYNDGNPHHLVHTSNSTGTNIYVDGVVVFYNSQNYLQGIYGNFKFGGDDVSGGYGTATIGQVAVYNTALSSSRVQAHYLAGTENCISQTALSSNVWNHLAGVFSSSGNTASLYLNGNQQCTIPLSGINYSGSLNDLTAGSSPSQTNFWSGAIASIRTYAQAMTSTLVQQNYAATAATLDIQQLGAPTPIMWLRADSIPGLSDGAPISTWPDSRPNGNNATQVTPANQPIWKRNVLNGYPVVRFDGTSSYMNGPSVFPTNQDFTIISVFNPLTQTSAIIGGGAGDSHFFGLFSGNLWLYHGGAYSASSQSINTNQWAVISATYNSVSTNAYFYQNGAADSSSGYVSSSNSDASLQIGLFREHLCLKAT